MTPKRIQRKRVKGWTMPEGVVYVGRGTRWGNPFVHPSDPGKAVRLYQDWMDGGQVGPFKATDYDSPPPPELIVSQLAGRDLACWCPDGQPCHADVLLKMAN